MARTKKRFCALEADTKETAAMHSAPGQWRTGLYARLSVDNAETGKDSIESQLDILRGFFQGKPEFTVMHEYIDRGWSGTNFHRPAFEEMMEDIRCGRINCIATKDLPRLGRDYLETSSYVETIFPFLGVRYISVNDHFDTMQEQNGNRDLEIALKNLVNDMYARDVSKRMSVARTQDQQRGKFVGSNAPYGYKVDETSPLRRFVIDGLAAGVVRSIYEMALEGMTLRSISLRLQELRLRIPGSYLKTGKLYLDPGEAPQQWYIGTISNILSSEAYIGNLVQGKRRTRLYKGEKQHFTQRDEWAVSEHAHPPIITDEAFYAVRSMMERKCGESPFREVQTEEFPVRPDKYSGLLFCGICGKKMSYMAHLQGKSQKYRKYRYECTNNYQLGREEPCRTSISERMLDQVVMQLLGDVFRSFGSSGDAVREACHGKLLEAVSDKEKEIRKNRRKLEDMDGEVRMVYESYVQGELTRDAYLQKREGVQDRRGRQEAFLRELEAGRDMFLAQMRDKDRWLQALSARSEGEPDFEMLHILISRIELFPGHEIRITYPFSREDFLGGGAGPDADGQDAGSGAGCPESVQGAFQEGGMS